MNDKIFAILVLVLSISQSRCYVPQLQLLHYRLQSHRFAGQTPRGLFLGNSDQDMTIDASLSREEIYAYDDYDDDDGDDDENVMFRPHNFVRKETWLEDATNEIFDTKKVPLGSLIDSDMESIKGLMVAWSRQNTVEAAMMVERLLKRVIDDMHAGNSAIVVTARLYAIVVDAWARSGHHLAAERAQEIHNAMIQTYRETNDDYMKPTLKNFNAVLKAWVRSNDPSATEKGERLFQEMITEWNGDTKINPDSSTIHQMLELYASDGSKNAIEKGEKLFNSTEELGVNRTASIYSALQNLYMKSGRDAPGKTMKILQEMIDLSLTVGSSVRPSCLNFNVVLCALSRDHRQQAATQAIELLEKMELPITEGGYDVRPDKMSYAMTILACSRQSDHTIGAKLAERLLERMENCARAEAKQREEVSSAARPLVEMDIECYNVVLTAISKSQDKDAVDRIFRIITRIANDASNNVVRPNMRSWNAALNALSRVKTEASAQQAEELLEQLFESYNNGTLMEKPNEFSYAAVLGAYQKVQTEAAARRADEILKHMDELYENGVLDHPPDVFHCTIVCSAWAKSGSNEAPKKCLEILSRMTARYKEGFPKCKPTTRCFAAVLDCFSRSNMPERAETLLYQMLSLARQGDRGAQPDAVAFDIVIYAFLNSNLRDAGQRAELVLERGLEFAQDEGGEMLKLRSFTAILGYYGSQKQIADSPYRAEYILNRLITLYQEGYSQLSPTVSCFTKVMDAYASQANQEAGPCAENLLKTMIKLKRDYGAEQLEVNTGVMNCVLNAWQASVGTEESGRRAERLLDLMEEKHDEGNFNMSPNFSSYTKVIATWSKSPVVDKADRALAVLNRMKKRVEAGALQVRTSDHAYGLVINACAFTPFTDPAQQMRLFEIAQEILNELLEVASREGDHRGPNAITYGWFFQALERLDIPEDLKYKSLERAFKICCTKGRLSQFAWSRMREATTGKQFMKLLRSDFPQLEDEISDGDAKKMINYSNLPMAWSRIESSAFNHGDRMTRNYKSS